MALDPNLDLAARAAAAEAEAARQAQAHANPANDAAAGDMACAIDAVVSVASAVYDGAIACVCAIGEAL